MRGHVGGAEEDKEDIHTKAGVQVAWEMNGIQSYDNRVLSVAAPQESDKSRQPASQTVGGGRLLRLL